MFFFWLFLWANGADDVGVEADDIGNLCAWCAALILAGRLSLRQGTALVSLRLPDAQPALRAAEYLQNQAVKFNSRVLFSMATRLSSNADPMASVRTMLNNLITTLEKESSEVPWWVAGWVHESFNPRSWVFACSNRRGGTPLMKLGKLEVGLSFVIFDSPWGDGASRLVWEWDVCKREGSRGSHLQCGDPQDAGPPSFISFIFFYQIWSWSKNPSTSSSRLQSFRTSFCSVFQGVLKIGCGNQGVSRATSCSHYPMEGGLSWEPGGQAGRGDHGTGKPTIWEPGET